MGQTMMTNHQRTMQQKGQGLKGLLTSIQWISQSPGLLADTARQRVLVVDRFSGVENFVDLDGDGIGELSHGEILCRMLRHGYSPQQILTLDIADQSLADTLDDALMAILSPDGESIHALCFAQQTFATRLSELKDLMGLHDLTAQTLHQHQHAIRTMLADWHQEWISAPENLLPEEARYACHWPVIQRLEYLAVLGIHVYVAAGNEGPDHVNLFSLAVGVHTVGACQGPQPGIAADYSANHSLVHHWGPGQFPVVACHHKGQVVGLSWTGGPGVDLPLSELAEAGVLAERRRYGLPDAMAAVPEDMHLWGSSFSVPWVMVQRLQKITQQGLPPLVRS
jgi:hypothetical protein